MARNFLHFVDSFNLQTVSDPVQEQGYTFDLVSSHGLPNFNLKICDAVFSDHMPVLFDITCACNRAKPHAAARCFCIINPSTAPQFLACLCLFVTILRILGHGFTPPVILF